MTKNTIDRINDFFEKNQIAKGQASTQEEINSAEKELGLKFDTDYIFFLLNYGGSMIKAKEIYGLINSELMGDDNIIELTKSYRQNEEGNIDWLIIGTDYSGNSIGINKEGNVVAYDHDFGELNILADSFEDYIIKSLDE
jgi:hypothetical protein